MKKVNKKVKVETVEERDFPTKLLIEYLQTIEAQYPDSVITTFYSNMIDGIVSGHTINFTVSGGHEYVFDNTPPELIEGHLQVTFEKNGKMIDSKLYLKR